MLWIFDPQIRFVANKYFKKILRIQEQYLFGFVYNQKTNAEIEINYERLSDVNSDESLWNITITRKNHCKWFS